MAGDFSNGKIWKRILAQTMPLMVAQFAQLLYNIVDRIYVGHLPGEGSLPLTGIGLTLPIVTLLMGFASLFGNGGVPLFSMARGAGDEERASKILGHSAILLSVTSVVLFVLVFLTRRPLLYLMGASDATFPYANAYLEVYLFGIFFALMTTGLNSYISAQGYPRIGMVSVLIGAIGNLILDPLFIFVLQMGVRGAAVATVISQMASCIWILKFLSGKQVGVRINWKTKIEWGITKEIMSLGVAGFIVQATNSATNIACNSVLKGYGDIYVSLMTVIGSVREVFQLPIHSLTHGSQPVIGYNYGAKLYDRTKEGIKVTTILCLAYSFLAWAVVLVAPRLLISIFTKDAELIRIGVPAIHQYFFGYCFMAFQFAGQSTFNALGKAKQSIFFSVFRKIVLVVPLTFLLPAFTPLGVSGVFYAEPISNLIGGMASFLTMYFTVYRKLGKTEKI